MPVVYVIHAKEDLPFVEQQVIRPLPALGFDRWLSSAMFEANPHGPPSIQTAIDSAAAILVVIPRSARVTEAIRDEIRAALRSRPPVIPLYLGSRNTEPADPVLTMLDKVGGIDASAMVDEAPPRPSWRALAQLLPAPVDVDAGDRTTGNLAALIEWNEGTFSDLLAEAVGRHDYNRSDALLDAFSRHIAHRSQGYPANHARNDLKALRKKRQFLLMRRYADAALQSGTRDFQVARQFAQALIELKDFERATSVLTKLIEEATAAKDDERFEARGLMGRLLKQRYVDAADGRDSKYLIQAIDAYRSVFLEDRENVWHGINAASCILRANRDGLHVSPPGEARTIAATILDVLAQREARAEAEGTQLFVWDCATRVEALIDVEAFDQASKALHDYLVHPGMDAFEASSTYRQFDEVLQLANDNRCRPLLDRLSRAAERLRSGGISPVGNDGTIPMLVRVSDPGWTGAGIPDLTVVTRLGNVIAVTGTASTVKALLKDALVTGIEESRPSGGQADCARSLPFIRVAEKYEGAGGSFSESGSGALVAIIDNGIDLLHEAFLDANGQSRVIGIWDQQDADQPASPPAGFDFGRYHSQADIAGYVAQKKVPASLSRPNDGHGTHVASIAAGRKVGDFAGGVAPEAPLLIVISSGDQPTGYSHAHLTALAFIHKKAEEVGKPVVVNLSQGMNAGAHDGKSPLEGAFDSFVTARPGRIVVKSAGNERSKRGHAKLTVPAGGADRLIWRCPPGPARIRLELWWHSANEYRFQLKSPSGDLSEWVERQHPEVEGYFKSRGPFVMKLVPFHPDNGDKLLTVEVDNGVSPISPSDWTLTVEAVSVPAKGDLHAWIERGGQAQAPTEFVKNDTEEMTLSIPGTSQSVITVGAIDADMPITVGDFSSFGPTRDGREKPDVCAPGVKVMAALRDSVRGVVTMDGTSMAAPHVTGAIALLLSKIARANSPWPTANQVGAVLRNKTRNYSAQWDRGQGYGVLDVAALLAAF